MLRKSYPFHTWENVMCVLHFLLVTNYDSGFIEVSLRRSPRIKQLSFGRTNSGSFYSVSQPKSRSIQRVHSFQQVKSGNILSSLSSGVHTNLVGGILGKRSMKSDIFLLDTGGSRLDINIWGSRWWTRWTVHGHRHQSSPWIHLHSRLSTLSLGKLPVISTLCSDPTKRYPQVEGAVCMSFFYPSLAWIIRCVFLYLSL